MRVFLKAASEILGAVVVTGLGLAFVAGVLWVVMRVFGHLYLWEIALYAFLLLVVVNLVRRYRDND